MSHVLLSSLVLFSQFTNGTSTFQKRNNNYNIIYKSKMEKNNFPLVCINCLNYPTLRINPQLNTINIECPNCSFSKVYAAESCGAGDSSSGIKSPK